MQFKILEENMARLEKKLATIQKKCEKFGCDFHYEKLGESYETRKNEEGQQITVKVIEVEVEGTAILNDWQFVATIVKTENGNLIKGDGSWEVPERYYTSEPICEHCNQKRNRQHTYIVRNTKTGEFKQIGKSCLRAYTNGLSAEICAQYMSLYETLEKESHKSPSGRCQKFFLVS